MSPHAYGRHSSPAKELGTDSKLPKAAGIRKRNEDTGDDREQHPALHTSNNSSPQPYAKYSNNRQRCRTRTISLVGFAACKAFKPYSDPVGGARASRKHTATPLGRYICIVSFGVYKPPCGPDIPVKVRQLFFGACVVLLHGRFSAGLDDRDASNT